MQGYQHCLSVISQMLCSCLLYRGAVRTSQGKKRLEALEVEVRQEIVLCRQDTPCNEGSHERAKADCGSSGGLSLLGGQGSAIFI